MPEMSYFPQNSGCTVSRNVWHIQEHPSWWEHLSSWALPNHTSSKHWTHETFRSPSHKTHWAY